ncbi:MAG: biosynthetic-type acetolactate synthase large subunit [Lachnospiraceae bacterium]|nr:biosynthetic-type acetolactate synthase large subunit [Lachnospiraceae bacterium]
MNGSELVIECLREHGTDLVFGYPGATNLALYDAMYRQTAVRHVLTAHEQGAAHAADGYARATGRVGVCMATSGPGATNLVTGIATAMMDSVPIIAITCNVTVDAIGRDSFQEIDIFGITLPITKHNFLVKDIRELRGVMDAAYAIAAGGRPGPVLVDIARDVTTAEWTEEMQLAYEKSKRADENHDGRVLSADGREDASVWSGASDRGSAAATAKAFRSILRKAKRPLLLVGGGCVISGAEEVVAELAEKIDAPVCETLMGKGVYSGTGERYLGMVGTHGTKAANAAIAECDCLIALGVRFSERVTDNKPDWCAQANILQIDIDAAEIDKNIETAAHAVGDVKEVLTALLPEIPAATHATWMATNKKRFAGDLAERAAIYNDRSTTALTSQWMALLLDDLTGGNCIITTEVGRHQMDVAQNYRVHSPRQLLTSGGLGTMGYGLPAAVGAAFGCPHTRVINMAGDGCYRMNMNELSVAAKYRLPIVEIVCDNHGLEMVRHWQHVYYNDRYYQTSFDDHADYVKIAEALGVPAVRVATREDARKALERALAKDGPMVIVCELR